MVIIHGGYWRAGYSAELGRPLARDLAARGWTCWNLEYRRAGNGGGWPETFDDVAAGIDALAPAAEKHGLDLDRVTALGHSAGAQLAVWAAGRADARVPLTGVVSQSGLLDLAAAVALNLSNGAVVNFLGATPGEDPQRYEQADPLRRLPLAVPVIALHGTADSTVPVSQSAEYVAAAAACGSEAELRMVPGDHYGMITPGTAAWESVVAAVADAARRAPQPH